jgi:truncated hemoglobin YjbI
MYNIAIVSNGGTCMFPISKELFEQWILGMHQAINDLNDKRILTPQLVRTN